MHINRSSVGNVWKPSCRHFPLIPVIKGETMRTVEKTGMSWVQIKGREIELGEMYILTAPLCPPKWGELG